MNVGETVTLQLHSTQRDHRSSPAYSPSLTQDKAASKNLLIPSICWMYHMVMTTARHSFTVSKKTNKTTVVLALSSYNLHVI